MFEFPTLESRRWRYVYFFSNYFILGFIPGFSLTALVNYFLSKGLSSSQVGIFIALIGIPWVFQFLWGGVVDRYTNFKMGRRRFWVVLSSFATTIALLVLFTIHEPEHHLLLTAIIFSLHGVFAALLDTAIDGLMIESVPDDEVGRTSGSVRSGFAIGTAVGGAAFAWTLSHIGYTGSVATVVILNFLLNGLVILVKENPQDRFLSLQAQSRKVARTSLPLGEFYQKLGRYLIERQSLVFLFLGYIISYFLALYRLRLDVELIQNLSWSHVTISTMQSVLAILSGTIGSLAIGTMSDRFGHRRLFRGLLGSLAALFCILFVISWLVAPSLAYPTYLVVQNSLPPLLFVVMIPIAIELSRGEMNATRFAIFMVIMNLGDICGSASSGTVQKLVSVSALTGIICLLFLFSLMLFKTVFKNEEIDPRKEFV